MHWGNRWIKVRSKCRKGILQAEIAIREERLDALAQAKVELDERAKEP